MSGTDPSTMPHGRSQREILKCCAGTALLVVATSGKYLRHWGVYQIRQLLAVLNIA